MSATTATVSTSQLHFVDPGTTQTLREGLGEYYASEPELLEPRETSSDVRRLLRAHDAAHVVFGCDTSAYGEIVLSRWSLVGATDAIPIYVRGLRSRETRWLFVEFFKKLRPLSLLVGMIDGLRAIVRGLRMRKRWPSLDFERHLDRPLFELRQEYGIRVL